MANVPAGWMIRSFFKRDSKEDDGACHCWLLEQMRLANDDAVDGRPNPVTRSAEGHVILELSNGDSIPIYFCPICGGTFPESVGENPDPNHHPTDRLYTNRAMVLTQEDAKTTLGSYLGCMTRFSLNPQRVSVTYYRDYARQDGPRVQFEVDPVARIVLSRKVEGMTD